MLNVDFNRIDEMINNGEMQERIENTLRKIENILDTKEIKYHREEKKGWGTIIVFEIKNKKVHCNGFKKNLLLDVYYYNEDYCCKPCRIMF